MAAADWDRRHAVAATERWDRAATYLAELAGPGPGRALDLACGTGGAASALARWGWSVTGVDFSPVALSIAAGRAPEVTWIQADLTTWQATPGRFDLIHAAYLHLAEPELRVVLEMAGNALAAGGRLVIIGHDVTNSTEGVGGPADPAVLYHAERLASWLTEAGLFVDLARVEPRPIPGESRPALDTVVVAHREGMNQ